LVKAKRKALRALNAPPPRQSNKPKLLVGYAYPDQTVTGLRDIMSKSGRLYERGAVVRIAHDPVAGGSIAHEPRPEGFILETHFACQPFEKYYDSESDKMVATDIQLPHNIAKMYLNWKGEWRLPPLNGFTTTPILDNEGSIRTATGYDAETGLWCENIPDIAARVPLKLTIDQANAALLVLRRFFSTFCFADAKTVRSGDFKRRRSHEESRLRRKRLRLLVARIGLPPMPMACAGLPVLSGGGSGKGLLARCACAIAYGRQPAAIAPGVGDKKGAAEELEKRVASTLLERGPAALFDNFNSMTLASLALESGLTERPSKVRKFGTLDNVYLNALMSIFITGNGILLARDLLRRIIATEFDAGLEDPETRPFKNDILADAMRQRDDLLVAVLTIWRYGRTHDLARGAPLGSYDQWCPWVRDPLLALGCKDPVRRMRRRRDATRYAR
jgi:hypothetical protein